MKIQTSITADALRELTVLRSTNSGSDYAAGTVQQSEAVPPDSSAVTISSTSVLSLSSAADIDADKVAAIKAALGNGTYSIDSVSIADGMLGLSRDLLQKTSAAPRVTRGGGLPSERTSQSQQRTIRTLKRASGRPARPERLPVANLQQIMKISFRNVSFIRRV